MGQIVRACLLGICLLAVGCHEPLKDVHITNKLAKSVTVKINDRTPIIVGPHDIIKNPQRIWLQRVNVIKIDLDSDGYVDNELQFSRSTRSELFDGQTIRLIFE